MENGINQDWADRRKALDPSIYKPKYYGVNVNVISDANGPGSGSVTLDKPAFVLDRVQHGILALTDQTQQDGQYLCAWRDDQTTYNNVQIMADLMFGSIRTGFINPLPLRVFYKGSKTISIDVTNLLDRTAVFPNSFVLQFCLIGFERWDKATG